MTYRNVSTLAVHVDLFLAPGRRVKATVPPGGEIEIPDDAVPYMGMGWYPALRDASQIPVPPPDAVPPIDVDPAAPAEPPAAEETTAPAIPSKRRKSRAVSDGSV